MKTDPFDIISDQLMSKREVADVLGISVRNVDRLVARGLLRRVRLTAGTVRFRRSEIISLIERATQ